jgi:alkylation response protein AidB-like acyl-CoA dehydrogenase
VSDAAKLIERARLIADDVLFPAATQVDRARIIDREHLRPLAQAGLFGLGDPDPPDGRSLTTSETRRIFATVAGGCGATFFVWAQHHGVVRTVASSDNDRLQRELLAPMLAGDTLAGVAFAHVRRADRRAVTARRIEGGWVLDGIAPWATSWGVADHFCIAAETAERELVWSMIPGVDPSGVIADPLHLPVFASTGTVALHFQAAEIADDAVVTIDDVDAWRADDRRRAAPGQTGVLGVADRAIRLLGGAHPRRDDDAVRTAGRLAAELDAIWVDDDRLVAELATRATGGDDELIAAASLHRAACLDLGRRSTTALLAASGGGGMDLGHPAQRLAREAMFFVIQAQTGDGRAATLRMA